MNLFNQQFISNGRKNLQLFRLPIATDLTVTVITEVAGNRTSIETLDHLALARRGSLSNEDAFMG
ncbi:MAG TPA: hypothetical protein DDZ80_13215 [Cyanobacteria bacterium UBA8803]|nr:hypothetical protein [Cyanobacteria bacterium UBA8803]